MGLFVMFSVGQLKVAKPTEKGRPQQHGRAEGQCRGTGPWPGHFLTDRIKARTRHLGMLWFSLEPSVPVSPMTFPCRAPGAGAPQGAGLGCAEQQPWGTAGHPRQLAGSLVIAGACAGERQQLDRLCFLTARQSSLNQRGMKMDSLLSQPERGSCLISINVALKRITLRQ